ncbi:MAG: helix-turn-helix domain-containing protein [Candidatus Nitrotoga sp.]|nr:helix-turn-helix domain-containing protein [Candidatus Nitrotoga sp.]
MTDKKKRLGGSISQSALKINKQINCNSSQAQRQRLLAWLQENGSIDTIRARHELDILGVGPRIFELRHRFKHNIVTCWTKQFTAAGIAHRVALYVLLPACEA